MLFDAPWYGGQVWCKKSMAIAKDLIQLYM